MDAVLVLADHADHLHHGTWWAIFPLFWILFVVGLIALLRRAGCGRHHRWSSGESVLAERYAKGEINEDEFRARREVLRERRSR